MNLGRSNKKISAVEQYVLLLWPWLLYFNVSEQDAVFVAWHCDSHSLRRNYCHSPESGEQFDVSGINRGQANDPVIEMIRYSLCIKCCL